MRDCQPLCMSGLSLMKVHTPLALGRCWHVYKSGWPRGELWLADPEPDSCQGVAAAASDNRQQQSKGFCYRCGGNHKVRECPEKRKESVNKGQKRAGCFWCGSAEYFVRNCPQPAPQLGAAAEEVGFWVESADRGGVSSAMETE